MGVTITPYICHNTHKAIKRQSSIPSGLPPGMEVVQKKSDMHKVNEFVSRK